MRNLSQFESIQRRINFIKRHFKDPTDDCEVQEIKNMIIELEDRMATLYGPGIAVEMGKKVGEA